MRPQKRLLPFLISVDAVSLVMPSGGRDSPPTSVGNMIIEDGVLLLRDDEGRGEGRILNITIASI